MMRYGWKPDVGDLRDYVLPAAPAHFIPPPHVDLRDKMPPVYQQGQLGSCTANAIAAAIQYKRRQHNQLPDFVPSRLFIYFNERFMEGTIDSDAGAMIRDGIKSVARLGVCHEEELPYDEQLFTYPPSAANYASALDHRAIDYWRVPRALLQMRGCLAAGFPFVFGFSVYASFEGDSVVQTGVVAMPAPGEAMLGGHAVLCLTGDTCIPLLDGTERTIAELAGGTREPFWVYSCDSYGNIVPGKAHSARVTGRGRRVVKVTLDNDFSIRCTPDHPFLMRDGTYRAAESLMPSDSLMPLYRKLSTQKGMAGYEMLRNPSTHSWRFTHRVVAAAARGGRYTGEVIHHDDLNKLNNVPSNLIPMSWNEHTQLHASMAGGLSRYAASSAGRERSRELMNALWDNPEWRARSLARLSENGKITTACYMRPGEFGFGKIDKELLRLMGKKYGAKNIAFANTSEAQTRARDSLKKRRETDDAFRLASSDRARCSITEYNRQLSAGEIQITDAQRAARRRNITVAQEARLAAMRNHKVLRIENDGIADVYDLTVEEHHNFAVSAGVFVHNCVGYDDPSQRFIVRNSWGVDWGDSGYFYLPYAFLLDENLSDDFWCVKAESA